MNIVSARYSNQDNTAVILNTDTAGAVAISASDTPSEWDLWLQWDGQTDPYDPIHGFSEVEKLAQYGRDLDSFLDSKAQELTFRDRHSLALRAGYPNEWQALGTAFGTWMDTCNALAWEGRNEILSGERDMPESKEEFLAELPPFVPPES